MKTVIAEKPSVAREIAAILGAKEKNEGYLSGNGYYVTWAFGHLVGLAMPEDYGAKGFDRGSLPIIPEKFILTPRMVKKGKEMVVDSGALKQLKIIESCFKNSDSIIVATDAGREGELIFRYIYNYLKCDKPYQRLWISSLTDKAIKQGLENLKPGQEFEGLYQAGKCRSEADWLVGINATQALTVVANGGLFSLGRVQTPTLALVCQRYLDNLNFTIQKYYQIQLDHSKDFKDFKSLSILKYEDRKAAEEALQILQRNKTAKVISSEIKKVTEQAPLLYDLTGLQKDANKKLGLSAEETLNIAQALYEKKFITYPRTGSKYIPEDMWEEATNLARVLSGIDNFKKATANLPWGRFNKKIVNNLKVTDHHGLLITDKVPNSLNTSENKIYQMIAYRLLESISPSCIKEVCESQLQVLHIDFSLKGVKVIEPGWRGIREDFNDDNTTDENQELPELNAGEELKIVKSDVLEKKTKPPVLYTEGSLLGAMESAGKDIADAEERKAIKGVGIGTPATRASIIETLIKREYLKREKKSLLPTEKGLQVYVLVKEQKVANVSMTAEWEVALQKIENGDLDSANFLNRIKDFTKVVSKELLALNIKGEVYPDLDCPKCKNGKLLFREKVVKCKDESCGWLQFKNVCGVQLSSNDIESLIMKGSTPIIKNMKSKSGKKFNAKIVLGEEGKTSFVF